MEKEIKIVLKDANDPEWRNHPFDVYINGESIPRLHRFTLDFKYFEPDQQEFDSECFKYTIEQFLDIRGEKNSNNNGVIEFTGPATVYTRPPHIRGETLLPKDSVEKLYAYINEKETNVADKTHKNEISTGGKVDLTGIADMRDKEHPEAIGTEASKKCLSNALKKCTYTTRDLLDEVSRIWNDENISDEFKDFLAKAIAGERNKETLKEILDEKYSKIKSNIGTLLILGFDISYDQDTNRLNIKNIEHVEELTGDFVEGTNKIREKTRALITETTSLVEEINKIINTID